MGESWDLHTAAADSDSGLMVTEACRQGSTEPLNIRGLPPVRAKMGRGLYHKYAFSVRGRRVTPAVFWSSGLSWAVCVRPKGRVTEHDQWATATGLSLDGLYCYL